MKVILVYEGFKLGSTEADMIEEWINEIVFNKDPENTSTLRYADEVRIEE